MFKNFKQELLFIPLMLVLLEIFRSVIFNFFPDTAVFDRGSELETFMMRMWQIVWISCGIWLLLRVIFPDVYKAMRKFYVEFSLYDDEKQKSLALKIFFCLFFGLVLLMSGRAQGEIKNEVLLRKKLVDTLTSQLYVREATGNNDGVEVERYLRYVGLGKGYSWCAAFASWNLNAVGITAPPNPKSAWAPNFSVTHIVWSTALEKQHKANMTVKTGDCFTVYYSNMQRVGHVGFITGQEGNYYITIEGNSGSTGSRDGEGVHKYKRDKRKVFTVTDYISTVQYKPPNKGTAGKSAKL